jgi:tetratricopeptide (TPR) repeat protein
LVQKATIWWLKEHDDWIAWTETAYGRLEELVPYGRHEGRTIWISYLPHAIHIADLCSTPSETRRASLLDRIGRCQFTLGQYATAEETHRRVLSLRRKDLGNEDASTLNSMSQLGQAFHYQGKYEEAEAIHRQTLALSEKVLGKEHLDTLTSAYCLAHLLAKQDLYDEATTLFQRACDGYSVVLRDDHPTARGCQQHYLEMLQRKEQRRPIASKRGITHYAK